MQMHDYSYDGIGLWKLDQIRAASKREFFSIFRIVVTEMQFHGVIIVILINRVYSISKILAEGDNDPLAIAAVDIVDKCFASVGDWSELLITADHINEKIVGQIHHESKISNVILAPENNESDEFSHPEEYYENSNTSMQWQDSKTSAVMITAGSLQHLQFLLHSLKNDIQRSWNPGSYFLIVLEGNCDVTECNNMLKVIWDYWILNAVILCSTNNSANRNHTGIEMYSFNPYSIDHPQKWETTVNETVAVSIDPGEFNHSWYIFKQPFAEIRSLEECGDLFFDKTSNLDGYVIPISTAHSDYFSVTMESMLAKWFAADSLTLKTIANKLRFDLAQVLNDDLYTYGKIFANGSYAGLLDDLYKGRSHLAPIRFRIRFYPGLEMTYPYDKVGACLASRIIGNHPRWTNLFAAKYMWIGLGLGLLFFTVVLYVQNKSHGILSAFLDAERYFVGSSIIRTSRVIEHRIILGSIFLVVLVVDGAIKGRFISMLTAVRPYPNVENFDQIKDQDMDVFGPEEYEELTLKPRLKLRYIRNYSLEPCLEALEGGESHLVCLSDCMYLRCYVANLSNIHTATTPVWSAYVTFLTTMHWPMTNRYGVEVQKLVESGILNKWQLDIIRDTEVNGWKLKRTTELPHVKSVKLNDLLPVFVLLFVGLSTAMIVSAWEMKCSKIFALDNKDCFLLLFER